MIGYLRFVIGWISVGWVVVGCGFCCLGLVIFVLFFVNFNFNVCGKLGLNFIFCKVLYKNLI